MSRDNDSAILHLMRAASVICDERFNANDLLLAIVAKRIPVFAGFPEDDHSGGRVHPNSRMSASSKRLGRDYVLIGEKVSKDPYLENLMGNLRAMGQSLFVETSKQPKRFT